MEFATNYLAVFHPIFPIKAFLILSLNLTLTLIGLLHFYWAIGGKWGLNKSVPSTEDGTLLFVPTTFQSAFVGFGLLLMVVFIFLWARESILPSWIFKYGFLILGGIFTLRAIGEFNYVGFFKKVKNTSFGKLDTMFYSPLCLIISGIFFWIANSIQT